MNVWVFSRRHECVFTHLYAGACTAPGRQKSHPIKLDHAWLSHADDLTWCLADIILGLCWDYTPL